MTLSEKEEFNSIQGRSMGFPGGASNKEPANGGGMTDSGWIPGLGRFPGGGHGNPFQYSCLENAMERWAWHATVHRVTRSQTPLKWLSMHACRAEVWGQQILYIITSLGLSFLIYKGRKMTQIALKSLWCVIVLKYVHKFLDNTPPFRVQTNDLDLMSHAE